MSRRLLAWWLAAMIAFVAASVRAQPILQDTVAFQERMIAPFGIAGNTSDLRNNPFQFTRGIGEPGGYARFFESHVAAAVDRGYKRIMLHRPFGEPTPDADMDLDARHHLLGTEWEFVVEEFAIEIRKAAKRWPDVTFLIYFGTDEPDLRGLYDAGEHEEHWRRMLSSLDDVLNATNCDIAFDASTGWSDDPASDQAPYAALIDLVRAYKAKQGRDVFIEALPDPTLSGQEWQADYPAIATTAVFWNQYRLRRQDRDGLRRIEGGGVETVHWYGHINRRDAGIPGMDEAKVHQVYTPIDAVADALLSEGVTVAIYLESWMDPRWQSPGEDATWVERGIHRAASPRDWTRLGLRRVMELYMAAPSEIVEVRERFEWAHRQLRYLN